MVGLGLHCHSLATWRHDDINTARGTQARVDDECGVVQSMDSMTCMCKPNQTKQAFLISRAHHTLSVARKLTHFAHTHLLRVHDHLGKVQKEPGHKDGDGQQSNGVEDSSGSLQAGTQGCSLPSACQAWQGGFRV